MVHRATHIFLGTLFILMSAYSHGMEINADKEEYTQIVDAENGDQIDLNKKFYSWYAKIGDGIKAMRPAYNKQHALWITFGSTYTLALLLNILFTYQTNINNPYDCQKPLSNWCTTNMQPITCCPQGESGPVYQCLSAIPQICSNIR